MHEQRPICIDVYYSAVPEALHAGGVTAGVHRYTLPGYL